VDGHHVAPHVADRLVPVAWGDMWKRRRGKKGAAGPSDAARSVLRELAEEKTSAPRRPAGSPTSAASAGSAPSPASPAANPADGHDKAPGGVDFTVAPGTGPADASVAPAQDESRLPRRTVDDRPLSRADRVGGALDRWAQQIDGDAGAPSFLTHMRSGRHVLDLTHSHPSGLAQLLAGRGPTRLSSLVREVGALDEARTQARAIREIAERQAEDVGLTTCHLGIGEASWTPEDGSRPYEVPVLIRPLTLRLRGSAREDVDLDLDATVDINPVLLRALREAGIAVDARALLATTDGPYGFDPNPVIEAFRELGQPLPGFRISHALVVGNLMDAAGPLVEDLMADRPGWVDDTLVAALAGDPEARAEAGGDAEGPVREEVDEATMVTAMEPDRRHALEAVLGGGHLSVTTPPGTEPLDLVVDLATELAARGKGVLVVSQRRGNLAALAHLAEQRGLEDLVFDLSPDPSLQRNASSALLQSLRRAGSFHEPVSTAEPDELAEARRILGGHVEAMHRVQQPWDASAHDALSALAALTRLRPSPRTEVRLSADVAAQMVGEARQAHARTLREAADAGVLSTGPEQTAWYGASVSSDTQAQQALRLVEEMREQQLPALARTVRETGPEIGLEEARTLEQLAARLQLLQRVRAVLEVFRPSVFGAEVEDMLAATAEKEWRERHGVDLGWSARRKLRKGAVAELRTGASAPDLHAALEDVRAVRDRWREAGGTRKTPSVPSTFRKDTDLLASAQRTVDELAVLLEGTTGGGHLARTDLDDLVEQMEALSRDQDDLQGLPERTRLLRSLELDGLGALVEDLRVRRVRAKDVAAELDLAWWQSVLELIAQAEPTISQYDGGSLSQVAERFRKLDAEYVDRASYRVRGVCDEVLVSTMMAFPDTSRAAIAELARSSTVSVRDLAAKYEDILFQARPLWLASPYLVPQVVPRGRHFDVVIVADGGRLPTAAALPAIARARQTVVIGDPLDTSERTGPTILDDTLAVLPHLPVRRDPRPAGSVLRAFAQRRSLAGSVLSVPSPAAPEPDRLIVVDGRGPVMAETDIVESTEAELRRVTDLVIEHARTRPERSLAVFTLTSAHARKLMERIMATVSVVPGLREFFDASRQEFFTVLPSVHASSVVRDDVIVSLGFGRTPHGRLLHRFGPLGGPSGRQSLATVISRARGRTTVVSSFDLEDLDPQRLRSEGAQDLRAMLGVLHGYEDAGFPAEAADEDAASDVEDAASGTGPVSGSSTSEASADSAASPESPAGAAADGADTVAADAEDMDAAIDAAIAARGASSADEAAPDTAAGPESEPEADADATSGSEADGDTAAGPEPEPDAGSESVASADADEDPEADADATSGSDGDSDAGPAPEPEPDAEPEPEADPVPELEPVSETNALVNDLADRLWRRGLVVETDFGTTEDRIDLALGHRDLPGRYLLAVDTDGQRYVATHSQRERDRLRAERLEAAGWSTERVWSWALFIDPDGEAERIERAVDRALMLYRSEEEESGTPEGVGTVRHRLPRPQIPAGHPLSYYASEDFDAVVEYICSDGRARLEDQLAAEVRSFFGFAQRSVLLDVSVSSAIRRFQERQ
jgi:hypothetical protein